MQVIQQLRKAGINTELYPETGAKMKKQMGYADKKCIPYVALVGETEITNNTISVKDMATGTQTTVTIEELIAKLK